MIVEHALRYAARGFHVVPVIGKKPAIARWPKLASTDPARIRKWWAKWPEASIGIATARSGLVVLDIDPRNGGDESLDHLIKAVGRELLDAPTVLASGGGRHLYFVRPVDLDIVRALRAAVGPGIDVPSIAIAPPSLHASGEFYRWEIGDEEIAPTLLPAAVISALSGTSVTLHPPPLWDTENEGNDPRTISRRRNRSFSVGAQKFAENRAVLERYARRFARPGTIYETPEGDGGTRLAPWVGAWVETPGQWIAGASARKNSVAIRDKILAVARDYFRVHGIDGETFFRVAIEQKSHISPAYRSPSPTSGDKRHPLAWEPFGKRAWERAVAEPTTDTPRDLDAMAARIPSSEQTSFAHAAAAYAALLLEAWRLGVRAEKFRKDYAALGRALGVSKMSAYRYVLDAENFGLVYRLDAGKRRAKGQRGEPTSFFIATAKAAASVERVETMVAQIAERRSRRDPVESVPTLLLLAG